MIDTALFRQSLRARCGHGRQRLPLRPHGTRRERLGAGFGHRLVGFACVTTPRRRALPAGPRCAPRLFRAVELPPGAAPPPRCHLRATCRSSAHAACSRFEVYQTPGSPADGTDHRSPPAPARTRSRPVGPWCQNLPVKPTARPRRRRRSVGSHVGALDEGPRCLLDSLDLTATKEVDRALAAEEAVASVKPLAHPAWSERVGEQNDEGLEFSEPVVGLGSRVGRLPASDGAVAKPW